MRIENKLHGLINVMLPWTIWIKLSSILRMTITTFISPNIREKGKEHQLIGQSGICTSKIFYPKIISGTAATEVLFIIMSPTPILLYSVILFLVGYGKASIS